LKENSIWRISGETPPYTVNQLFTSKGTISKRSVVYHLTGGLFFATAEGILSFNGASTAPYLTDEIRDIWYADNPNCKCEIKGDVLLIYAQLYHPLTGVLGNGILAVDIPTKNICYWDMKMGESTLEVACTLDPWFTTLKTGVIKPEFWFGFNDMIYRYSNTKPTSGAEQMTWYYPATDLGIASKNKSIATLTITGSGGTLKVTPIANDAAKTVKVFELPKNTPTTMSVPGKRIGFKLENDGGDPTVIKDIEIEYRVVG
jgi:hypothetical protein